MAKRFDLRRITSPIAMPKANQARSLLPHKRLGTVRSCEQLCALSFFSFFAMRYALCAMRYANKL
jgi:hypothetical protein